MLVVGFSWTWFEVKKDLGNMGDELFQGITWTWMILWIYRSWEVKEVMHNKMPCFISQQRPLTNQTYSPRNQGECFCDPLDGNYYVVESSSTNSHANMCKSQYASHLAFGIRKLSHVSKHMYANKSFTNPRTSKLNGRCATERPFTHEHPYKEYFFLSK